MVSVGLAMPPTSPAFPPGPYHFANRDYFIIRYRTDPEPLRRALGREYPRQGGGGRLA